VWFFSCVFSALNPPEVNSYVRAWLKKNEKYEKCNEKCQNVPEERFYVTQKSYNIILPLFNVFFTDFYLAYHKRNSVFCTHSQVDSQPRLQNFHGLQLPK